MRQMILLRLLAERGALVYQTFFYKTPTNSKRGVDKHNFMCYTLPVRLESKTGVDTPVFIVQCMFLLKQQLRKGAYECGFKKNRG